MSQLQIILGENGAKIVLWSLLGLAVILVAIIVILAIRRLFGASFNISGLADRRNRPARLGVTDFFNLDRQGRKLVIVRRDNVEHLVLIGGPNDLLIEQNIIRGIRPELPVVDTFTRPTVSSKLPDDPNADIPSTSNQNTRFEAPDRVNAVKNIGIAPKPDISPVSSIVSRLNIPKLNVPNLDLRTATPVQKTPPVKAEPVETIPKTPEPEISQKPVAEKPAAEAVSAPKIEMPAKLSEPLVNPVLPETSKVPEPAKQPASTAFGDATKRLEEALRRPTGSSQPKITESAPKAESILSQPDKPTKSGLKESVPESVPVPAQKQEPEPAAKPSLPVTDTLVLDLEQEMARLLGRVPGKGL